MASVSKSSAYLLLLFFSLLSVDAHIITPGAGAQISFLPHEPPLAGPDPSRIIINLYDDQGNPLTDLSMTHERLLHAFIIGQDLRTFIHTHPEEAAGGLLFQPEGRYDLVATLPYAGEYLLILDYSLNGSTTQQLISFQAEGAEPFPARNYDLKREKRIGAYTLTLLANQTIIAGKETGLDLNIEKDGEPVRDLQMLLGTEVHVLIASEDLSYAVHTHTYIPNHYVHTGAMAQRYSGPTVPVRFTFPWPGRYTVFEQFMHDNQTVTAQFIVEVKDEDHIDTNSVLIGGFLLFCVLLIGIVWIVDRRFR